MYQYKIKEVIKVVDGDTVDVFVDLGFNIIVKKRIRLYGLNAPETRLQSKIKDISKRKKEKELGLKSKDYLKHILCTSKTLYLSSEGLGKYGRVLGVIKNEDGESINELLIENGFASRM